jgi:hypothetical protein
VLEFVMVVVLVGALVLLLAPRIRRWRATGGSGGSGGPGGSGGFGGRGGPGSQMAPGTLLVTGVSAGAESDGSQHVTISGVINGPTVREHAVYARMVMPVGSAPAMGQLMPVVYSPKNPEKWGFAPPEPPPNYPPPNA